MSKKCFDDFSKTVGRTVEADEQETLLQKVRKNKETLKNEGKDFETQDGDVTSLQKIVENEFNIKTKNEVDKTIRRLSTETQLKTRFEELDKITEKIQASDKKLTKQRALQRAFISMIYNTNDTADIPLENIEKSLFQNSLGEF